MINMLMENWKEIFLNEKKQYDADMEKLEEELAALAGTGRRGKRAGKLWEESRPGYGISGRGYERQTDRKGRCLSG